MKTDGTASNVPPILREAEFKLETSDGIFSEVPVIRIRAMRRAGVRSRHAVAHSVLACAELNETPTDEDKCEIQGFFPEVALAAEKKADGKRFWPFFIDELGKAFPGPG